MNPSAKMTIICIVATFIFSFSAYAQRDSGAIVGKITDVDQSPIPGVTVIATSSSLIGGTAESSTDQEGNYRFPVLPSGSYQITATLSGFQSVSRKEIRLFVGKTVTIDLTLQPSAVSEKIEIVGESPLLDVKSAATPQILSPELIENLPRVVEGHSLFTLTPGVGPDRIAYGASSTANGFWFDGVDYRDPNFGNPRIFPNLNWIEEVQVVGIGAPAEYGAFTGVVTNSIFRSGGNQFHGLIESFYSNSSLNGSNSSDPDLIPPELNKVTDSTVQLGGPIIQDRLWFFSGFHYFSRDSVPQGYVSTYSEMEPRFITKLTGKINNENTVQGFVEWDYGKFDGVYATAFTPIETTFIDEVAHYAWNSGWTSFLSSDTFLDFRFGGYSSYYDDLPRDLQTPGHFDVSGYYSVNGTFTYQEDRSRNQFNGSISHYSRDFIKGNHDFKFGIEYERSKSKIDVGYPGGIYYVDYYGEPYYRYLWEGYSHDARNSRASVFAQDTWSFNDKLNLNLGLRWDHNTGKDPDQGTVFQTDPIAPRIGFTYDLKGDHKSVIKAHFGHYYETIFGSYYRAIGPYSDFFIEYFNPDSQEWELVASIPANQYAVDPNVKQPYVQQFTAGLDQELPHGIFVSAHYIYRKNQDIIEDVVVGGIYEEVPFLNPVTNETINVFNLLNPGETSYLMTNPPDLFRRYDALQLTLDKRFGEKVNLSSSFVWSRAKGNSNNGVFENIGLSGLLDDPNTRINWLGKLQNDPTYEFKVKAVFSLPWSLNSSLYLRHATGDTWTPRVVVRGLSQGPQRIFAVPLGSERLPSQTDVNVRVEKAFGIGSGDLRFTVDILNLLNSDYPLSVDPNYDFSSFGQPLEIVLPREVRLGIRYTF